MRQFDRIPVNIKLSRFMRFAAALVLEIDARLCQSSPTNTDYPTDS